MGPSGVWRVGDLSDLQEVLLGHFYFLPELYHGGFELSLLLTRKKLRAIVQ